MVYKKRGSKKIGAKKRGGDIYGSDNVLIYDTSYKIEKNEKYKKYEVYLEDFEVNLESIPDIYKYKICEIFIKYNNTNKGVILNDAMILRSILDLKSKIEYKKELSGGASLSIYMDSLIRYCNTTPDDNSDIKSLINTNTGILETNSTYSDLKDFIKSNKIVADGDINISYDPTYDYSTRKGNGENDETRKANCIVKSYKCFNYNKDIITAYEHNFYDKNNIDAIEKYIIKQKNYISGLSTKNISIIQDYTNEISFNFYNYAISNPIVSDDIFNSQNMNFGDAFYYQILFLYPDIFDRLIANNSISSTWNTKRIDMNSCSIFKNILTQHEWREVLKLFMKNLDKIIIDAPAVEKEIYCYRGVTCHYITSTRKAERNIIELISGAPQLHSFLSNRLSSFSLDFDQSKRFSDLSELPTKCVYRTTIMPQCRVLFVSQISVFNYELEFIAPCNSIFYYRKDQLVPVPVPSSDSRDRVQFVPDIAYNNIKNEYGICSKDTDKFNSFDTVLAFTPQPFSPTTTTSKNFDQYTRAKEIAQGIERDVFDKTLETMSHGIAAAFLEICPHPD